jgi:DinB superfamily
MPTTADVDHALERFAALDEKELAQAWRFRDKPVDVRYALYRTIEDAQEAIVAAVARPHPESRRILSLAQRAFGDLRGLLIGLPAELLDTTPRDGEWSVRETLRHILVIEGRYAVQTRYAVERTDADPMRVADDRMPTPAQVDVTGGISRLLERVAEARAQTDRWLGDLPAAAMVRPTQWMQFDTDVRFRLHRFAAHLLEHTVQLEKTLATLSWRATEGRRIVRRLTALLGEVEGLSAPSEAQAIEQRLVERAASL